MKIFTLRATTEEQKVNQAFQLRLFQVLAIVVLTVAVVSLSLIALFGKIPEQKIQDLIYLPSIIILIGIAPSVMKYSWKVLLPRIIISTVLIEVFLFVLNKFLS